MCRVQERRTLYPNLVSLFVVYLLPFSRNDLCISSSSSSFAQSLLDSPVSIRCWRVRLSVVYRRRRRKKNQLTSLYSFFLFLSFSCFCYWFLFMYYLRCEGAIGEEEKDTCLPEDLRRMFFTLADYEQQTQQASSSFSPEEVKE